MRIPILMYHGVGSASLPYRYRDASELEWVIDVDRFRRHLLWLQENGYRSVLLRDLESQGRSTPEEGTPVVITFDDGHETCRINALPALEEHGMVAEFFVTSGWTDSPNYMTRRQLREMVERGMSVQAHGETHHFLPALSDQDLRRELEVPRARIRDATGEPVDFLAFPGGRHDARVERFVREAGYRGSCTSVRGYAEPRFGMFSLPRLGITKDTSEREFRAMVSRDLVHFAVRGARARAIAIARALLGRRAFDALRRRKAGAGAPREGSRP